MTRITLATPSREFETRARQAMNGASANGHLAVWNAPITMEGLAHAVQQIADQGSDVVAIGPGVDVEAALGLAGAFDRDHPHVSVVLIAHSSPSLLEEALRVGVRDIVAPEAPPDELRAVLDRALETATRRRGALQSEAPEVSSGTVIMVVSPKGGSGKTTISTNLAVGLGRANPKQVAIVDLDLQFGDVANTLRLVPEQTIAGAARAANHAPIDATEIKAFLTPHPAGLYALCAPEEPAEADVVRPEHVAQVVKALASEFRYVVIDTGSGLDDAALAAVDIATDIVLVCSTDVPTVRGMRKCVRTLDLIGATRQGRVLVLNRADARVGLSTKDIEATVGRPIDVTLPSSRAVPLSTNQGTPILESADRTPLTDGLAGLAGRFTDVPIVTPKPTKSSWRSRRSEG